MTAEQAIEVLNMVEAHGSLVIQAKDMAIQALQAQAETKCNPNDCPHPYGTYETCMKCKEDGNNVKAQADREYINKKDAMEFFKYDVYIVNELNNMPSVAIPSAEPKTVHLKDFAVWVASEIFDDNWEYNKDAFAEIACRKLNKLGIVKANGDKWELVEPQESEGTNADSN